MQNDAALVSGAGFSRQLNCLPHVQLKKFGRAMHAHMRTLNDGTQGADGDKHGWEKTS